MNRRMFAVTLALVVAAGTGLAEAAVAGTHVSVAPAIGTQKTKFVVRFKAPNSTISSATVRSHYQVYASTARGKRCSSSVSRAVGPTARGTHVRITLGPAGRHHVWCAGRFRGLVVEVIKTICRPLTQIACPALEVAPITIGRFSFRVIGRAAEMKAIADLRR